MGFASGMSGLFVMTSRSLDSGLHLDDIGAPLAVLDRDACVLDATPSATALLSRFQLASTLPAPLAPDLARELSSTPYGVPIMWRPRAELDAVIGCTRYQMGDDRGLLLMREITEQQRALSQRMHRQRLEETGRLAALMAHDLRTPLSSIVYNVDVLSTRAGELGAASARELLHETKVAADQMRRAIAGLLDFVRLGPPVTSVQSLREIFDRVSSLLRPMIRAGEHALRLDIADDHALVRGNPLTIEQIFVNLLINAMEATDRPVRMHITATPITAAAAGVWPRRASDDAMVLIRVADDGPGIPVDLTGGVFEPFATSKPHGTGLGLTIAREAAQSLGGQLTLERATGGCVFAVVLPTARPEVVE